MIIFRNYNDFEIVNLIRKGDDEAFAFMVDKYKFLIAKKIRNFNLVESYEDIYQEALMILHKSVLKFDEHFNKSFTRYFEMNLTNKLISLKKKHNNYGKFLAQKLATLCDYSIYDASHPYYTSCEVEEALSYLSDFEKVVFNAKIINRKTVRETAQKLKCSEKKIYNALDRIKNKIKKHLMT